MYKSTKTYGHERGLSCCYRQWRDDGHCNLLHGYALSFEFTFVCADEKLDHRGWVMDFGGLKSLEQELRFQFDHTTLIAKDDPELSQFETLDRCGLINLRAIDKVGCEAFARAAFLVARDLVCNERVKIMSCKVCEHGANSATYEEQVTL